jgi:hypothetical protein
MQLTAQVEEHPGAESAAFAHTYCEIDANEGLLPI